MRFFNFTSNSLLNPKLTLVTAAVAFVLTGCSSKHIDKTPSDKIYHAPAQAYNLSLNNPAILGQPRLQESCSVKGNTLEIRDKVNNYYKIDVINLFAYPELSFSGKKEQDADIIANFYRKKYKVTFKHPPTLSVKSVSSSQLYIPLPLEHPGPIADSGKVVGLLVSKYDNFLFVVQHVQQYYNQQQMLNRLTTLQNNMRIPGQFTVNLKKKKILDDKNERIGFININPSTASSQQLSDWKKAAKCS